MTNDDDGIVLKSKASKIRGLRGAVESAFIGIFQASAAAFTGNVMAGIGALSSFFQAAGKISVEDEKERLAYLLVAGALSRSLEAVLSAMKPVRQPTKTEFRELANTMLSRLGDGSVSINQSFFREPEQFGFLSKFAEDIDRQFETLLRPADRQQLEPTLRQQFLRALDRTWAGKAEEFKVLEASLQTPFSEARKREKERERYLLSIQRQFDSEPLMGQPDEDPVLLSDVFVPLRAYWEREKVESEPKEQSAAVGEKGTKSTERVLVEASDELIEWIRSASAKDPVRVVSGGPGIGKSSTLKAIAHILASGRHSFPIFVQLLRLEREGHGSLQDRIGNVLRQVDAYRLSDNPLGHVINEYCRSGPIVLFLDGLDEIVVAGSDGDRLTRDFVRDVKVLIDSKNLGQTETKILAIISGRVAAAEKAVSQLQVSDQQLLHLLPFDVDEPDRKRFCKETDTGRLEQDQRQEWWKKWRACVDNCPEELPGILKSSKFEEVSREPLLLYFLAFVEAWKPDAKATEISRNLVYRRVLMKFHERELAKPFTNFADKFADFDDDYEPTLQALAMAAWSRGTSRVGRIEDVGRYLRRWDSSGRLDQAFNAVVGQQDRSFGASLAFHLKQAEGHDTFNFLHKSFTEYLVARRFVKTVDQSVATINLAAKTGGQLTLKDILRNWLWYWGIRPIDHDLLEFIRDEFRYQHRVSSIEIERMTPALVDLFRFGALDGFPAHELVNDGAATVSVPHTFAAMTLWARNAEEALLVALNGLIRCGLELDKSELASIVSIMPEQSVIYLAETIHRLDNVFLNSASWRACLSSIDFKKINLYGFDLVMTDFSFSNLSHSDLRMTNFFDSNFHRSNIHGANLIRSNLSFVDFSGANLTEANLEEAGLFAADFTGAKLNQVNFAGALVSQTDFSNSESLDESYNLHHALDVDNAKLPKGWSAKWNNENRCWNIKTPDGPYSGARARQSAAGRTMRRRTRHGEV